jgi:hypothetical protein
MKAPSKSQLERQVLNFNQKYTIGDTVVIEGRTLTVKAPASILGGHSAVGWFKETSGCYSIDRVNESNP